MAESTDTDRCVAPNPSDFYVSEKVGFLLEDPLKELPSYFAVWHDIASKLPQLLEQHVLRDRIDKMALLDHTRLEGYRQWRLAHNQLCMMGNAYVWQEEDNDLPKVIPKQLAIPWFSVSEHLGLKPVLSNCTLTLGNYKVVDTEKPLSSRNCRPLYVFSEGFATEWFVAVNVQVELDAVPGVFAICRCQSKVLEEDQEGVCDELDTMKQSVVAMTKSLATMREHLEPMYFYKKMKPWFGGWGGPASPMPDGLTFEGFPGKQQVIGGSAAQSTTVHSFDAALSIVHEPEIQEFHRVRRLYMPPAHARFVEAITNGPSIRDFVESHAENQRLKDCFDGCITALRDLRSCHIRIVGQYVVAPSTHHTVPVEKRGTGGTLLPLLKNIRNTTVVSTNPK